MYGIRRMWLKTCPEINSRTAIMLPAAHKLRFCSSGSTRGPATVISEIPPSTETMVVAILT